MSGTLTLQIGGSIELLLRPPPIEGAVFVTARYGNFTVKAKGTNMAYNLPVDMCVDCQVAYEDSHGNPAKVDGDVTWTSSDETIATVIVNTTDSTSCTINAVGALGNAQVTATADADLGSGTRNIITLLDITAVAGEAVAGTITITGEARPVT